MVLTDNRKNTLLQAARLSMENAVKRTPNSPDFFQTSDTELLRKAASFVTLKINGNLRGCIGSVIPTKTLIEDVRDNAAAGALRDPRFSPVTEQELSLIDLHISVLSDFTDINPQNEYELFRILIPEVHGLILNAENKRATFLPSVWEMLPDKKEFMMHLLNKAGLRPDYDIRKLELITYKTENFSENKIYNG